MRSRLPNNSKENTADLEVSGSCHANDDSRYHVFHHWTGHGKRVLYIGGNAATCLPSLYKNSCTIVAIQFDTAVAEAVRSYCDRVLMTNAENLDIAGLVEDEQFDVVLLDDVLGTLRQPSELLARLRLRLTDGGVLIASASNFAHGSIRLALLSGAFDPAFIHGTVDGRTRLFTFESLQRLCDDAQLQIQAVERITHPILEASPRLPDVDEEFVDRRALAAVAADSESTTLEYLIRTSAAAPPEVLPELSVGNAHLDSLVEETAKLRDAIAERDDALAQLDDMVTILGHEKASLETQCQTLRRERDDLRQSLQNRTRDFDELHAVREQELREAARREAELLLLAEDAINAVEAVRTQEHQSTSYVQELEAELERAWTELDAAESRYVQYEIAASDVVAAAEQAAREAEHRLARLQSDADELEQRERYARARNESLEPLARQLEAERTRLASELESSQTAVANLRERLQALEQRFVDQTNGLIAATEAETERIASLIDAVQTSKFWTLKRWVRKLTGRR